MFVGQPWFWLFLLKYFDLMLPSYSIFLTWRCLWLSEIQRILIPTLGLNSVYYYSSMPFHSDNKWLETESWTVVGCFQLRLMYTHLNSVSWITCITDFVFGWCFSFINPFLSIIARIPIFLLEWKCRLLSALCRFGWRGFRSMKYND